MKLKSFLIAPISSIFFVRTKRLFADMKQSFSDKLAALIILLVAVIMVYTVFLCLGVLIAVVLMTLVKIRLFYTVLIVFAYLLLLLLVSFFIGKGMLSHSMNADRRKMDIFK